MQIITHNLESDVFQDGDVFFNQTRSSDNLDYDSSSSLCLSFSEMFLIS